MLDKAVHALHVEHLAEALDTQVSRVSARPRRNGA